MLEKFANFQEFRKLIFNEAALHISQTSDRRVGSGEDS
jgi:hypothetical protein